MKFFRHFSKRQIGISLVAALSIFCVCVWTLVLAKTPHGVLTIAVLNIGQGDSIYIEGPTGVSVVLDGGPDDSLLRELPTVMPLYDHRLDAVIESHPDADHIAGFVDLLKRYSVGEFVEPGIQKDTLTAQTLEKEIATEKIPKIIARRGMVLDLDGGAELDVLYPDWDVSHMDQTKDNDGGIVMHLVYGKTSALLMADTSTLVEHHLMQISTSSDLESDILKVGHHGSKTSSAPDFVAEVSPSIAIISAGKNNSYGLPKQQTLDTLTSDNIQILRTDEVGTVEFQSDGTTFKRVIK